MRTSSYFTALVLSILMCSCAGPQPIEDELLGTWESADGATVTLSPNGSMSADSVPTAFFIRMIDTPVSFSGVGSWAIAQHNGKWCVDLKFTKVSFGAGSSRNSLILDHREDSIVLFTWVADEGGDRYELFKRK